MDEKYIDAVKYHLLASKNISYKKRVRERFSTFISFIQMNGLTTRMILNINEMPDENTVIKRSDLTEEGFEVVRLAYYKWLQGHDRGKPISDISVLEKALKKVRGNA